VPRADEVVARFGHGDGGRGGVGCGWRVFAVEADVGWFGWGGGRGLRGCVVGVHGLFAGFLLLLPVLLLH